MQPAAKQQIAYVLDDEAQIGAVVAPILKTLGFAARQFDQAAPFLAAARGAPPDLIVLDLALGETDAVDVIRQLEALKYRGRLLLISGRDETILHNVNQVGKGRSLMMLPPLQKPFRLEDVKRSLAAKPEKEREATEHQPSSPTKPEIDLGEALKNGWLELWYQPKIELKALKVCGVEALLRANHPEKGLLLPAQLLPPPGDPLYKSITAFVLKRALHDWVYFAEQGMPLRIAVNAPLSVLQLADFIPSLREALPKDLTFPGLIVEVTEDEAGRDFKLMQEVAAQLKLYNIWLSIDDFGAGYSSLSRLRELPCAEIKLDRSFVSGCPFDTGKQSICSAAIELAHAFGTTVCAEGVESMDELRTLVEMGCDTGQGYLFAKPMNTKALISMLSGAAAGKQASAPAESSAGQNSVAA